MAANTPITTRVRAVDEGICPRDQLIVVSKCRHAVMISCGSSLGQTLLACDALGFPYRVNVKPPAAQSAPSVQPTRPTSYAYHRPRGRHHGRRGLFDFLGGLFTSHGRSGRQ